MIGYINSGESPFLFTYFTQHQIYILFWKVNQWPPIQNLCPSHVNISTNSSEPFPEIPPKQQHDTENNSLFCSDTSLSLFSLSFLSLPITLCSQLFSSVCPRSAVTYLGCEGQPRAAVIWQPQAQSAHCVWPAAGMAKECAHTIKSIKPPQPPEGEQTWTAGHTVALRCWCQNPHVWGPTFTFRFTAQSIILDMPHCHRLFFKYKL